MRNVSREQAKNGRQVVYVAGNMEVRDGKKTIRVRGAISGDGKTIWIQADHDVLGVDQIARHEEFHAKKKRDSSLLNRVRRNIVERYSEEELTDLVNAYIDAYGWTDVDNDYILEEILADAYGGIDIFDYMDSYEGATRFSEVTRDAVAAEEGTVETTGEVSDGDVKTSQEYWRTDLNKTQMEKLLRWVKHDIQTSTNSICDTANWTFREFDGLPVLAIYSTEHEDDPTILYEVKGKQAEYERDILKDLLEVTSYGESANGKSELTGRVLSGSWVLETGGNHDDSGSLGRESSVGDAGVLQKQPGRKPSAAFRSVLENLLKNSKSDVKFSRELDSEGNQLSDGQKATPEQAQKNTTEDGGVKDCVSIDMTEDERYTVLKERSMNVRHFDADKIETVEVSDYTALEKAGRGPAFTILKKIGQQFGVFKDYRNMNLELDFGFSRRNLFESVNKQDGEYRNYAKMMSVFDDVVESAIGIEVHKNRYERKGEQVKATYVFASSFSTDTGYVPVLLEVREFTDGTKSTLRVAVSLHEIGKSRIVGHNTSTVSDDSPYPLPAFSTIRLADLFANVNTEDGRMLKYIPDGFLNEAQKDAKQKALEEQEEYDARKNARSVTKNQFSYSRELENVEILREQNEALREKMDYWKGQTKRTTAENRTVRKGDVEKLARRLVRDYDSTLSAGDIAADIQALGDFIVRGGDGESEMTWAAFGH